MTLTHYADDTGQPACHTGQPGDLMTLSDDQPVTCRWCRWWAGNDVADEATP